MNLGMSVRAELFRARRMKLAVIIALMYLGIAGIYVFAGSGAWVSAGGEGQFFGFSADPGYLFSIGVGPTGISSWLSVVSMAHTVYFPIDSVVAVNYTHLRAHETPENIVSNHMIEKKKERRG